MRKIVDAIKAHWLATFLVGSALVLMGVDIVGSGTIEVVDLRQCFSVACTTVGDGSVIDVVGESTAIAEGAPKVAVGARYRAKASDDTRLHVRGATSPGATYSASPEPFSVSGMGNAGGVRPDAGLICQTDAGCFYTPGDDAGGITCRADVGCGPQPNPVIECIAASSATTLEMCRMIPGSGR